MFKTLINSHFFFISPFSIYRQNVQFNSLSFCKFEGVALFLKSNQTGWTSSDAAAEAHYGHQGESNWFLKKMFSK